MKNTIKLQLKTKIFTLGFLLVLNLVSLAPMQKLFAADPVSTSKGLTCGDASLHRDPSTGLCVPIGGGPVSVNQVILRGINILLGLAATVAILYIVIGGYQYITSAGNEEQAGKGRKTVTNAVIGLAIIILSFVIVRVVNNALSNGGSGFLSGLGL